MEEQLGVSLNRSIVDISVGKTYLEKKSQKLCILRDISEDGYKGFINIEGESFMKMVPLMDLLNPTEQSTCFSEPALFELTDKVHKKIEERLNIIRSIQECGPGEITHQVKKFAQQHNVTERTIYRWLKRYRQTNSALSFLRKRRESSTYSFRCNPELEVFIQSKIVEYYLTPERLPKSVVIRRIQSDIYAKNKEGCNYKIPHTTSIRRKIDKIPEDEQLIKRGQKKSARQKYRAVPNSYPEVCSPLDVIQIDHTPLDILLVDEVHRKHIGRAYLTIAIDVKTRMIAGYYLTLEPPSQTSVGMCIYNCVASKEEVLSNFEITNSSWPVNGLMKKIHTDNGADFRADHLSKTCAKYRISFEYRPIQLPEFGGCVERVFRTLAEEIKSLPGKTFSNTGQRKEYNAEANAAMTLKEFEKWLVTWIVQKYHNDTHSSLKRSPLDAWCQYTSLVKRNTGTFRSIPADMRTFYLDLLPYNERTIQREGISMFGYKYYDKELDEFINKKHSNGKNKLFSFAYDIHNIGHIWFYNPVEQKYYKIKSLSKELDGISVSQLRQLQDSVKAKTGKNDNKFAVLEAIQEMNQIPQDSIAKTKKARRDEQRRKAKRKLPYQPPSAPIEEEWDDNIELDETGAVKL